MLEEDWNGDNQKSENKLDYERNIINLSDGGTMSIDWYWPDEVNTSAKSKDKISFDPNTKYRVLIVIPGISGHSQKPLLIAASGFSNRTASKATSKRNETR